MWPQAMYICPLKYKHQQMVLHDFIVQTWLGKTFEPMGLGYLENNKNLS